MFRLLWLSLAVLPVIVAAQETDYDQGVALFSKGQAEAAIPYLIRATESQPEDARAWKALGVVYASLGSYERAAPAFERACTLAPRLVDACYFHGRALYASNRFEQSMAALRRALASGFDTWQVHLGLAQALEALARADEAGSEFRKSVGLCAGRDPGPVVSYARYLIRQGRGQEAAPLLEQTLRQFPRSAEAHTHLGRILLDEGRLPAAIQHLEHAVTLSPESSQAHFLLAKAYVQSGRADDARPHFEAAARYEEGSRKDR